MLPGVNPAVLQGYGLRPGVAVSSAHGLPVPAIPVSPPRLPIESQLPASQLQMQQLIMNQMQGVPQAAQLPPAACPSALQAAQLQAGALQSAQVAPAAAAQMPAQLGQVRPANQLQSPQVVGASATPTLPQEAQTGNNQQYLPVLDHQAMLMKLYAQRQFMQQLTSNSASSIQPISTAAQSLAPMSDLRMTPSPNGTNMSSCVVLVSNLNAQV